MRFPLIHCRILSSLAAALLFSALEVRAATDSVITFNEINYHPPDPSLPGASAAPEWVEFYNPMSIRVDVGGWSIRGGIGYVFPEGTVIEPGALVVVSAIAGTPAGSLGPFTGRLDNAGEEIRLHERWGRMMDRVEYGDSGEWPAAADGSGPTLAKLRPDLRSETPISWSASSAAGGTPGAGNFEVPTEVSPRLIFLKGGSWKYETGDTEPLPEWTGMEGFNDSSWSMGTAPLATPSPAQPPEPAAILPGGKVAYYFRRSFGWSGNYPNALCLITGTIKGRAEIYLNGHLVGSAAGSGEFGIAGQAASLQEGANLLAVKITPLQPPGSPDVALDVALTLVDGGTGVAVPVPPLPAGGPVINEIAYHARPVYADPVNGIAFAENPQEWIEMHNPGSMPVDLAGWRLSDAVRYDFPAGSWLPPGGFLVVNQGQFSGSLSNRGERLRLHDALGAVVDEVPYSTSGLWPALADGGGSTMERTDPRSDGRNAGTWKASDESAAAPWQNIRYRATGAEPPGSNNPAVWREFLLGFLDAGEALIDDVSVVEDPDTAKVQCIQNGTFEGDQVGGGAARWRFLGTHKLSRVEADPDGTGKVLRLVATDPLEHTYNNASTTLTGNRIINPLKTYEISFRAKWLSGSPQLNSRLYLNRAARTTILAPPASWGTPGLVNRGRIPNAGPSLEGLRHSPLVPAAGQPVRVSVNAADPDQVAGVTLFYSTGSSVWQQTPMGGDGTGRYFGVIPGQAQGLPVQFYVQASDGLLATTSFPPSGAASRAIYKSGDGGVSVQPVRNKLRLYMNTADANAMHDPVHSISNFRWRGSVIYNDRDVWYDVGVRLRASPYGRQGNRAGWNLSFGADNPFRGGLTSVVIDGAFNMPRTDGSGWLENSLGPSVNEMLFHALANRAGGIPASYDDVVFFQAPRTTEGNRRAQLKLQRFNRGYLEEAMPDGGDGLLFKQELIYYPQTTVDGNPESLKRPYNAVLDMEIRSFGVSRDSYRFNYIPQNRTQVDDFSGIIALGKAFDSPSSTLAANVSAAMDVDNWMRVFALNALTGLADTYNNGLAHNIQLYVRPGDAKVMLLPWDQDHAFYFAPTSSIYGSGSHRLAAIINLSVYRRLYAGHLRDLCLTAFNNPFLDPVINHLHSASVADRPQYASVLRSYVTNRRNHVLSQIASNFPAVAFTITTNLGNNFSTAQPLVNLQGRGWINVREILVSRNGSAPEPAPMTWVDGQQWRLSLPVIRGENSFALTALDHSGAGVGTDSITITNTGTSEPAAAGNLVISEIHYHPAGDPLGEYIELMNIGVLPVVLDGAAFTAGIDFTFSSGSIRTLAPGQRLLIVANRSVFEAAYGSTLPITGEFAVASRLSNSGDRLTLVDAAGAVIADFSYQDTLPWPVEADGTGRSLTLIRPESNPDPSQPSNWRPSRALHGSPGSSDSLDRAAFASLLEYALVSPPSVQTGPSGVPGISWQERIGADSVRIVPEVSEDLTTWSPAVSGTVFEITETHSVEGTRTLNARLTGSSAQRAYVRIRVEVR